MFPTPTAHEAAARAGRRFANATGFKPFINRRSFLRGARKIGGDSTEHGFEKRPARVSDESERG